MPNLVTLYPVDLRTRDAGTREPGTPGPGIQQPELAYTVLVHTGVPGLSTIPLWNGLMRFCVQ